MGVSNRSVEPSWPISVCAPSFVAMKSWESGGENIGHELENASIIWYTSLTYWRGKSQNDCFINDDDDSWGLWGFWVCMCVCGMLQCALDFLYLGLVVVWFASWTGTHSHPTPLSLSLSLSLSFTHTPTHMPTQHTQTIRNLGCLL
jgi:hypothetical protein